MPPGNCYLAWWRYQSHILVPGLRSTLVPSSIINFSLVGTNIQLSTSARGYSNKKPSINDVLPGAGGGELPKAWKVLIGCVNAWQGGGSKNPKNLRDVIYGWPLIVALTMPLLVLNVRRIHAFWREWDSHHGTISRFRDIDCSVSVCLDVSMCTKWDDIKILDCSTLIKKRVFSGQTRVYWLSPYWQGPIEACADLDYQQGIQDSNLINKSFA